MLKTSLIILGLLYRIEKRAKIDKKHPGSSLKLKNVLKIAKKPPKASWVFFDIEKCAKNFKKNHPKTSGSSLQNLKMC